MNVRDCQLSSWWPGVGFRGAFSGLEVIMALATVLCHHLDRIIAIHILIVFAVLGEGEQEFRSSGSEVLQAVVVPKCGPDQK